MKRLLSLCLALLLAWSALPASPARAAYAVMTVRGGWLNLRTAPSTDAEVLGSYFTGVRVTVMAQEGDWSFVRTQDGKTGYMVSRYLTQGEAVQITAYVTSGNGRPVRLREEPDSGARVITTLKTGTKVTILSKGNGWHYIVSGDCRGYMMAQYLTTQAPMPAPEKDLTDHTAWVTSENGRGVNLRRGPGTGWGVRKSLTVGTEVTVLGVTGQWRYVSVGGQKGYMMTCYLTTDEFAAGEGTAAVVVSPDGRRVNLRTGPSASSGIAASYPVGTEVTVINTYNDWSYIKAGGRRGYMMSEFLQTAEPEMEYITGATPKEITRAIPLRSVFLDSTAPAVGQTLMAGVLPTGATATYQWIREDGQVVGTAKVYTVKPEDEGCALYCVVTGVGQYTGTMTSEITDEVQPDPRAGEPLAGRVSLGWTVVAPGDTLMPGLRVNCSDVVCQWYVGGMLHAQGPVLTVTEAMLGKEIHLLVLPGENSGYTGQLESEVCLVVEAGTYPDESGSL